jgi:hypothetical protein
MKTRTFKNPIVLQTMLYLRSQGWPIKELAIVFNCDHSNIRRACLRNNLPPRIHIFPRPTVTFQWVFNDETEGRINVGKSYKEYLRESHLKPLTDTKNRLK